METHGRTAAFSIGCPERHLAGILVTRRSFTVFLAGLSRMALVASVFAWQAGLGPRAWLAIGIVLVYLHRMNWVLVFWTGNTA